MILISCPLSIELKSLVHWLENDGHVLREERAGSLTVYVCDDLGWILGLGGHGKVQFGVQTQFLIHHYPKISAVICIGASGALAEDLKIGDAVVATATIEHDFKEKFIPQPLPVFAADGELLAKVKNSGANFHLGIVASGDEDVVDRARALEIFSTTKAHVVAWEGAGGARVCKFLKIPYLEIRGVTDTANHNAVSDFKTHLKAAVRSIYKVLISSFGN